ncbi:MAG: hypothetical protein GY711_18780 [bacterium]|nr:hypothetical protein [bacterium]
MQFTATTWAVALALTPASFAQQCQVKLLASDGAAEDLFGTALAISGDTAIVGAPWDDDLGARSGSCYVLERAGSAWIEVDKMLASDGMPADFFGLAVALDGDTAVVGARGADGQVTSSGAAYVFERTPNGWVETGKLFASDADGNQRFGQSVSISGDTVVVGANWDDTLGFEAGAAYVFERTGTGWLETTKLAALDGTFEDEFGVAVVISGDTILVGAIGDFTPNQSGCCDPSGSAYVFERSATGWTQSTKLIASDASRDARFGSDVALSGDAALIGAVTDSGSVGFEAGAAYVFERSGGVWTETNKLLGSDTVEDDRFGKSVSIVGDRALITTSDHDVGTDDGAGYVFERTPGGWVETDMLLPADGGDNEDFGSTGALFGATALIGARYDADQGLRSGAFYAFECIAPIGSKFCGPAADNSTGAPGVLLATGSPSLGDDYLSITAAQLPQGQFGYFLASMSTGFVQPPGSSGFLCLAGNIGRFNQPSQVVQGPSSRLAIDVDAVPVNPPAAVLAGDTWHFQCWYRDAGNTSNFTDAVSVTFL